MASGDMNGTGWRPRWANWLLVPLLALSLALIACGDDEDQAADATPEPDVEEAAIGSTVTVTGEINDFVSARVFTVGGEGVLDLFGDNETLVLVPRSVNVPAGQLGEDAEVKVTGQVVRVVEADLRRAEFPEPFQDFQEPFNNDELDEIKEFDDQRAVLATQLTVTAPASPTATVTRTPTATRTP